jgi:hypothetical protein
MQVEDLTPEQLEAILGTDYETVLADILRQKASADERRNTRKEIGQVGDGNVFFDPAGAIDNVLSRRRAEKDMQGAQKSLDETLAKQNAGRRTYAEALTRKPQPMGAPRSVDSTIPGQAPQAPMQPPVPGAPPMATGAPPALANAQQMPPNRLAGAGVPQHVQALLAKLRGR